NWFVWKLPCFWPENCGNPEVKPSTATVRVVNGVEAIPHSWPWQASPFSPIPYMHGCGGSLIHEEWILTAAHCFIPLNVPSFWRMCLGKHHMNSSMDIPSAEECYKVDTIIRHKGFVYEQDPNDITNDIALVHLAKPVNMIREISPICLPKPGVVMPAGTPCFVTGWGDEKGKNSHAFPTLLRLLIKTDFYKFKVTETIYSSCQNLMFCSGDSGGPLACTAATAAGGTNTIWEVHGIVSFGAQGCIRDKKPSVFTRVSAFSDWIDSNIKKYIYESGKAL
uniref:Zgc:154142 n=1 Tax=Neolamprologus brichardi TaxID=32507 RepID=A0A3Q4HDT6_NEOBR